MNFIFSLNYTKLESLLKSLVWLSGGIKISFQQEALVSGSESLGVLNPVICYLSKAKNLEYLGEYTVYSYMKEQCLRKFNPL